MRMTEKFHGIFPAFMTAFAGDDIDRNKIRQHAHNLKQAGVHGLYTGGSSGEMVLCTQNERMNLLETVMEEADGLTIIAHIGALSTRDSAELARHAAQSGADAVSSVTPLYFKYSFAEIKKYYQRLCDAAGIPLIIYNIPALSGTALNFDQLSELLNLPGVGGMKFTSSDFFLLNRLVDAFPDKVFYNGSDEMLLSGLSAGAHGGIGTTYNFMPGQILSIYNLFREGKLTEAHQAQTLANRVIAGILKYGAIPASKQMIAFGGLDYGICREPFLPLDEDAVADLYENAWKLLEK